MDLDVSDEHAEDFANTMISVLRPPAKNLLSCMLNTKKCIPAPGNLPRDWRGLSSLLNCTIKSGCDPTDPIGTILDFCEAKTTIAHFTRCLQRIDRYDVVDETRELFIADIIYFKERTDNNKTYLTQMSLLLEEMKNPTQLDYENFDVAKLLEMPPFMKQFMEECLGGVPITQPFVNSGNEERREDFLSDNDDYISDTFSPDISSDEDV